MIKGQICESEQKKLDRLQNFKLLPNVYQKVGIGIFVLTFIALLTTSYWAVDVQATKVIVKKGLVVGLLLITISKDKVEDELTQKLRAQSIVIAFIIGVVYFLLQPFIEYGVDVLISGEAKEFTDMTGLQVMVFILLIQVGFYRMFKRMR